MTEVIGFIGDVLGIAIVTIDTYAVTPGGILGAMMIVGLAFRAARKLKSFA